MGEDKGQAYNSCTWEFKAFWDQITTANRDKVAVGTFWEEADREGEARDLRKETGIECDGNCFPLSVPLRGKKRTNKKQQW